MSYKALIYLFVVIFVSFIGIAAFSLNKLSVREDDCAAKGGTLIKTPNGFVCGQIRIV